MPNSSIFCRLCPYNLKSISVNSNSSDDSQQNVIPEEVETDDEIDDADEKVGVYQRVEDWVVMEEEMNEEGYTTASEDEKNL